MTGQSELDRFLRTDPRDVGCAKALEMLHVYAELAAAGEPMDERYPGIAAHLGACGPCGDDFDGLLASLAGAKPDVKRHVTEATRFVVGGTDPGLRERLDEEINAFNAAVTGHHDGRALSVAARGDDGELRGGLYGWTWGECGYIELLWVRDDERGSGLGTKLLEAAEAEILSRGCDRVALSTHSFQAQGFYARFGYTECGRTPGYPRGYDDIHMMKRLA